MDPATTTSRPLAAIYLSDCMIKFCHTILRIMKFQAKTITAKRVS